MNLQGGIAVVRGSCVVSCVVAMRGRSPGAFCVQGEKRGRIAHFSDDIRPGYVCLLHVPAMRCWAQFAHDTSRGCLWVRVLAGRLSRELAPCCRSFLCSTLPRCGAWFVLLATLCCVLGSRLGPLLVQSRVCQRCSHPRILAIPVVYTRSTTRGRSLCMHHLCTACGALLLFRVALLVFMPSSACRSRHFASRLRLCTPSVRALQRSSAGTRRSMRTMWRGQTAGTCSMSTWVLGGWDLGL